MNIRDLKYLVNVAQERSFSGGAAKSFVSQPTLSMQIKKLEEELGVQIFEREGKNFIITKVGEDLIKKAKTILHEAQEMKNIAKNAQDPYSGELVVGAFPTLAPYFFPQFVKKVAKKFPNLKLFLVEEKSEDLIQNLQEGKIDIAFLASNSDSKNFKLAKIFQEDFLLAVPLNHRLARHKMIDQKDLKGKEFMLLEEGHCLRDQALEICSMAGALESQTFKATSLETLRQMVIAGSGITLIPQIAVKKEDKIAYIKIKKAPKREIDLCWRAGFAKQCLTREIVDLLRENGCRF